MSEGSAKKEFDHGDRAWTKDGVKVLVVAETTAGQYAVAPFIEIGRYNPEDGQPEEETGVLVIVDELFAEPPRQLVDADIAKAKEALEALRDQIGQERQALHEAQAERRRLVDKLKDIPALQHIERMIEGKMRFVVIERYGDPQVMTIEEAQKTDGWRDERRLITLVTAKEGLGWRINAYRDGSGSDHKISFFETAEEAKADAVSQISLKLHDAYVEFLKDDQKAAGHRAQAIVGYAKKLTGMGAPIPDDIAQHLIAIERRALEQVIDGNRHHASSYQKAIDEAQARLKALDEGAVP